MNKTILFLSIAIWPLAMFANDDKCGCSKPRPAKAPQQQVSRPGSELPKPAPQQRAEADEPRDEREEIVEQVQA